MSYHAVKGRRHQGEDSGGATRFHLLLPHGILACSAVPRGISTAKPTSLSGFLAGEAGEPVCHHCKAMAVQYRRDARVAARGTR